MALLLHKTALLNFPMEIGIIYVATFLVQNKKLQVFFPLPLFPSNISHSHGIDKGKCTHKKNLIDLGADIFQS